MGIGREQRFTRKRPCPVCGGGDDLPRGKGERCSGYVSTDGKYFHCSRHELAPGLDEEAGGTYAHRAEGSCKCGTTHDMRAAASSSPAVPERQQEKKHVATYSYTDEHGAEVHQVLRYVFENGDKTFRQRHRNGGGEWEWKLDGVRRVLYKLHELVADDADRTVYIVEGEKDVESLTSRGYLATCNAGGVGEGWSKIADHMRAVLAGRNVVIVADRDDAQKEQGRTREKALKHARTAADILRGHARSLKLLWSPTDAHKDISDLFAAGLGLDALVEFESPLDGLPELAKVAVLGAAQIRELAARPIVYLWRDIAIAGIIVVLAGGAGSGKTTLLFLILAARLTRGAPVKVLGREVTPLPDGKYIVLIEGEHSDTSASRKLVRSCQLLGVGEDALDRVILIARRAVRIGSPAWQDVEKLIAAGLVSDVALDTLARVAPGEENSESAQVAIFDRIAQAVERAPDPETRPVVWVVAHKRKGEGVDLDDVAGSMQRVGQADTVLMVVAERTDGRVASSKVTFAKLREDPEEWPAPVTYVVKKTGVVTVDEVEQDDRPLEVRILERIDAFGPQTAKTLREALKRNDVDVQTAISTLYAAREIQSTTLKVRGREYKAHARRVRRPGEVPS